MGSLRLTERHISLQTEDGSGAILFAKLDEFGTANQSTQKADSIRVRGTHPFCELRLDEMIPVWRGFNMHVLIKLF